MAEERSSHDRPHPHRSREPVSLSIAILTVSDTRSLADDRSGELIRTLSQRAGHTITHHEIVPDDPARVGAVIVQLLRRRDVEVLLLNGGTGISGRDRTPEAVAALVERRLDGFGEIFRSLSFEQIGPAAMLSRAIGGIAMGKPIFAMPGSPAAVRLAMERLILPELPHVTAEAARED